MLMLMMLLMSTRRRRSRYQRGVMGVLSFLSVCFLRLCGLIKNLGFGVGVEAVAGVGLLL